MAHGENWFNFANFDVLKWKYYTQTLEQTVFCTNHWIFEENWLNKDHFLSLEKNNFYDKITLYYGILDTVML